MQKVIKKLFSSAWFVILIGLTPLIWFWNKPGILINGVDTNFPLDPTSWIYRRLFVWDSVSNAGADFSYGVPGLFFHFIQFLPYFLGFNLQITEMFSFVFWFTLIALSSYVFSCKLFPKNILVQILFVILYCFNIYLFNTWENVKVTNLALVSAIPLGLTILMSIKDKTISYKRLTLYTAALAVIVSGTGVNPAYFIVFFLAMFIYFISSFVEDLTKISIVERLKEFIIFTAVIILINMFWILPLSVHIAGTISPSASLKQIGFSDWTDSLSVNTNIMNVARMQGAWDWYSMNDADGSPVYIPYAPNYFLNPPFIIFSFVLPGLAFLGLIFIDKKRKAMHLTFITMMVVGIFFGAGTHDPTGNIYRFLLKYLPFFSLFRSPWYIFTPLLIISIAGLVSLLFYNLSIHFADRGDQKKIIVLNCALIILIIANLLYCYPLVTGKIFRPSRPDSFYVKFPDYVIQSKNWVNKNLTGRVISYPNDGLERFNWGYTGVDSILSLYSQAEVMYFSQNANNSAVSRLVGEIYDSFPKGAIVSIKNLSSKLAIDTIFEKKDQSALASPSNPFVSMTPVYSVGQWRFYSIFGDYKVAKIQAASATFFGYPFQSGSNFLSLLNNKSILLNSEDSVVNKIQNVASLSGAIVLADNSQVKDLEDSIKNKGVWGVHLKHRDLSKVEFRFFLPKEDLYQPVLERYKVEEFGLPISGSLKVLVDQKEQQLKIAKVDDSYIYFEALNFSLGEHSVTISLEDNNLVDEKNPHLDDQDRSSLTRVEDKVDGNYLSILNLSTHDVAVSFDVKNFDPIRDYLVQVRYNRIYGRNAAVLSMQKGADPLKAEMWDLPINPEWNEYSFYQDTIKTPSNLTISLIAKQTGEYLGSKILYKDLKVSKVFSNKMIFVSMSSSTAFVTPEISYVKRSPVLYEAKVTKASGPHILVFSDNYSPDWNLQISDKSGRALELKPLHFSANMFANAWYIEGSPDEYNVRIYYSRQDLLVLGAFISVISLLVIIIFNITNKLRRK